MQVKAVLASSLATIATAQSTSSTSALASSGLSSSLGSASATAAAGQTIRVDVGKNGLNFSPSIVQASPGAKVEYHYYPKNNSVTQSSFQLPCQPLAGGKGINSGFNPTAAGEAPQVFTVTVNDTNPVWIYCAQTNGALCQSGMSMVINQPAGANSLAAYQNASKSTGTSGTLATIQGGVFSIRSNSTSNSTTASTSSRPFTSGTNSTTASTSSRPFTPSTNSTRTTPGGYGTTSASARTTSGAAGTTAGIGTFPSSSTSARTTPATTPARSTPSPFGPRYTGGAALEAVSWGVLGAGAAVAGFLW